VIICIGFALVGNINFVSESAKFETFRDSILTVVDASLGNFKFTLVDEEEVSGDATADIISDGRDSANNTS
jgi:hypothetical protein